MWNSKNFYAFHILSEINFRNLPKSESIADRNVKIAIFEDSTLISRKNLPSGKILRVGDTAYDKSKENDDDDDKEEAFTAATTVVVIENEIGIHLSHSQSRDHHFIVLEIKEYNQRLYYFLQKILINRLH